MLLFYYFFISSYYDTLNIIRAESYGGVEIV